MDDLIGKVLAGEATAGELTELESWLQADDENRSYFSQMKIIFEKAGAARVQLDFDTDAAWKKVKHRMGKRRKVIPFPGTPDAQNREYMKYWSPFKVAAVLIMMIGLWYVTYQFLSPAIQRSKVITSANTQSDTLPDGSTAFLNKKSEVSFEYSPRKKIRMVKLKGEAFFEVRHDDTKPFVIETGEVLVKDLGTAFNVKAYEESKTVEVMVQSGEVQVYTLKNPGLSLHAGDVGIYDKVLKEFSRIEKIDTNGLAYKTKVFSFNNTDLRSVIDMLNNVYNVNIRLSNEALNNCHLTVNFTNDKIETVLEVLAETLNLKLVRTGNEIVLEGAGCDK
jgi:transmembrane sensor